jgi:hypothetical protein
MSTPFRSEVETVREQLRRAEERVRELSAENAELVHVRGPRRREKARIVATLGAIAGALIAGYFAGSCQGHFLIPELDREYLRQTACGLAQERASQASEKLAVASEKLAACQQELAKPSSSTLLDCQSGDPLCDRSFSRSFESTRASATVAGLQESLESCLKPRKPLALRVLVAVAPPKGRGVGITSEERKCAVDTLRHADIDDQNEALKR